MGKETKEEMEMEAVASPINQTRLWIEHAKSDSARRAEIEVEMLAQFALVFRPLSADVGVWESALKGKK